MRKAFWSSGVLEVVERSVKEAMNWDDEEKVEDKEMAVLILTAG